MVSSRSRNGSLLHFLGAQAVERRCLHAAETEHQVQLAAMMCLVLEHRPKPLPNGDRRPGRRLAFLGQARVGQLREQCARLAVKAIVVLARRDQAVSEVAGVARITSYPSMNVFRVHVAFDPSEMPNGFTRREPARTWLPLEVFLADAVDDATCARVNAVEVLEKWCDACDFHDRLDETLNVSRPSRRSRSRSRSVRTAGDFAHSAREKRSPLASVRLRPMLRSTMPSQFRRRGGRDARRSC